VAIQPDLLLAEVDELLRNMPAQMRNAEALAWRGRLRAVLEHWSLSKAMRLDHCLRLIDGADARMSEAGKQQLVSLLHEARHSLWLESPRANSFVIRDGAVFEYFDELRKIIELAKIDILFIDRYLDPSFVARFLPHVSSEVPVRLLTRNRIEALLPAVDTFASQYGTLIQVRTSPNIHDRFVIIDRSAAYQSGASFKDGAKDSPVTVTQIIDAFAKVLELYDNLWNSARVER